jgi:hypothetical protein
MFTDADIKFVLKYAEIIGRRNPNNHFSNLNESNVKIDTSDVENDTLVLDGAFIQREPTLLPGIVPRAGELFVVYVPCVIRGSYWEPDDYDSKEIGSAENLTDALILLYLYSEEEFLNDAAGCLHYEMDKDLLEEKPWD